MTETIKYTSNLNDLNLQDKIIGWKCSECDQPITEENYKDGNYTLWFDENMENNQWKAEGNAGAKLVIWIDKITHEKTSFYDCPDTENCAGCGKKFTDENLKVGIGEDDKDKGDFTGKKYYCHPCFDEKFGEYLKERSKRRKISQDQKEVMRIVQKALNEHLESNYHHGGHDYSKCAGSECEGYKSTLESYGYEREK